MVKQEIESNSGIAGFLYSYVFITVTYVLFCLFSLVNAKARRGLRGRIGLFQKIKDGLSGIPEEKRVWFHASSLGEFEQAKPIIEILKRSGYHIIVTFFSPSGYEYSKKYPDADYLTYIPIDTKGNAKKFVSLVKPCAAVIMRYDLWMNHLEAARRFGTKIIVADATFPMKLFQRAAFLRSFYRRLYSIPHAILTTTAEHKKMFDFFLGADAATVAGDTRFDRVYSRSVSNNMPQKLPFTIDRSHRKVLVLGSVWREDLDILAGGIKRLLGNFPSLTVIIVPHEPTSEEVNRIRNQFPGARVLSQEDGHGPEEFASMIVDRVGMLTQLYILADVAYVGGGFGAGVHSVLEPAVYGMPIVTGPRIERSDEAVQLLQTGALFFVKDEAGAYRVLHRMIENEATRKEAGKIAKLFVDRHLGASAQVAAKVVEMSDGRPS